MNEIRMSYKAVTTLDKFLEGSLDGELKSAIRTRAIIGGICMAIPLWGIETIVFVIALWGTYQKISEISTVPFKENFVKNVLGAIILNIVIAFVLGLILDFLPVLGWVGSFALGYAQITISGMAYVKTLKAIHGNRAKTDLNIDRGIQYLKDNNNNQIQG